MKISYIFMSIGIFSKYVYTTVLLMSHQLNLCMYCNKLLLSHFISIFPSGIMMICVLWFQSIWSTGEWGGRVSEGESLGSRSGDRYGGEECWLCGGGHRDGGGNTWYVTIKHNYTKHDNYTLICCSKRLTGGCWSETGSEKHTVRK